MCIALLLLGTGSVKNVTAATNTHATVEELLNAYFSMRSISHERKVVRWIFPEIPVLYSVCSKHFCSEKYELCSRLLQERMQT
jgi:hypothetical protein